MGNAYKMNVILVKKPKAAMQPNRNARFAGNSFYIINNNFAFNIKYRKFFSLIIVFILYQ